MNNLIFWAVWACIGIIMLIYYGHTKRPVKNAAIGMTLGGAGLVGVHFWGGYLGVSLGLNFFNTVVSLILGLPGVIMLVIASLVM